MSNVVISPQFDRPHSSMTLTFSPSDFQHGSNAFCWSNNMSPSLDNLM